MLTQRPAASPEAIRLVPAEVAVRLSAVPFEIAGEHVRVAMMKPDDLDAVDELAIICQRPIEALGISQELLGDLMRQAYGATASAMASRLGGDSSSDDLLSNLQAVDAADVAKMAEEPSVINLVNLIILEGVRSRASDVHIEPFDKQLSVKYRIDGQLRQQTSPPRALQAAITSRIKIMSGMDIAERYVPQDGHITLRFEGRKIDIRVSTVPTMYGESVVMRILDKSSTTLDLAALGMDEHHRIQMQQLIDLPHGMVLVTGPTGSGKTTTLYAALTKLYDPSLKIITIEDPVEYELSGINQIPVNPDRGLMFSTGLRAILRQDPDVVMVGEIRDNETAEIAVRAALTGHLIFSTLHTNDAASAISRLIDMEIEPFLLASVLEGVLAQRLGRKLCPGCRTKAPIAEVLSHRLMEAERALFPGNLAFVGQGCDACEGAGTRGRVGYYELLMVTPAMRASLSNGRTSTADIVATAEAGYVTMRRDGLNKASQGRTSVEEVLRATQDVGDK
jgi:type IV pilus assembly protein PilB